MKTAIPSPQVADSQLRNMLVAVKSNLDSITGQHQNSEKLTELASTATTAEIINQLNAILRRIQG